MRSVHETIEDGIGDGRIVEPGVPVVDRQLAGDERRLVGAAIIDDFEQVVPRGLIERRHAPVIQDQHIKNGVRFTYNRLNCLERPLLARRSDLVSGA